MPAFPVFSDRPHVHHIRGFLAAALGALCLLFALFAVSGAFWHSPYVWPAALFGAGLAIVLFFLAAAGTPLLAHMPRAAALLAPLVLALALRAVWLYLVRIVPQSDFARYMSEAEAILRGAPEHAAYMAVFPHTLGYTAMLSALFSLTGVSIGAAQMLNLAACAAISLLLFSIGERLRGKTAGFWAAALWAVYPSQLFAVSLPGTELVFTALFLACVRLYLAALAPPSDALPSALLRWGALGLFCALASAVRPMWPIFLVAFPLHYWCFTQMRGKTPRARLVRAVTLPVLMVSVCMAGVLLTYTLTEQALGIPVARTGAGWNLYLGMNTASDGRYNTADEAVFTRVIREAADAPSAQAAFSDMAETRLQENLQSGRLPSLLRAKLFIHWSGDSAMLRWVEVSQNGDNPSYIDLAHWQPLLEMLGNAYHFLALLLFAAGIVQAARRREYGVLAAGVLLWGFILLGLAAETNQRYIFPVGVLFCMGAACFLDRAGFVCTAQQDVKPYG